MSERCIGESERRRGKAEVARGCPQRHATARRNVRLPARTVEAISYLRYPQTHFTPSVDRMTNPLSSPLLEHDQNQDIYQKERTDERVL